MNTKADRLITFSKNTMQFPQSLINYRIVKINYDDIITFNYAIGGIKIIHKNGKTRIDKSGLKGIGTIDKVYNLLEDKTVLK